MVGGWGGPTHFHGNCYICIAFVVVCVQHSHVGSVLLSSEKLKGISITCYKGESTFNLSYLRCFCPPPPPPNTLFKIKNKNKAT